MREFKIHKTRFPFFVKKCQYCEFVDFKIIFSALLLNKRDHQFNEREIILLFPNSLESTLL